MFLQGIKTDNTSLRHQTLIRLYIEKLLLQLVYSNAKVKTAY